MASWTGQCCECGFVGLMVLPGDRPDRQTLCPECWRRMPSPEIVRRSHEHDRVGHANCRRGVRVA